MKLLFTILFTFITLSNYAQTFQESIEAMKAVGLDVTIEDKSVKQNIEQGKAECLVSLTVDEVDEDKYVYQFNVADINEHKVKFDTKKNEVIITAETRGGRDLILLTENGESAEYTDKIEMYAQDIEAARKLVDLFKKMVTSCDQEQSAISFSLGASPSFEDGIKYISDNLPQSVKIPDSQFEQRFEPYESFLSKLTFEVRDMNKGEVTSYIFNINDIAPNTIHFDTKSGHVFVQGEVKGGRKLIETYENGEKDNYTDEFLLYMDNIENARKFVSVLKFLSEKSDGYIQAHVSEISNLSTLNDHIEYLTNKIKGVIIGEDIYDQMFKKAEGEGPVVSLGIKDESDATLTEYYFNLADLNDNQINFDTKQNYVLITLPVSGGNKLIKTLENSELKNYDDEIELYAKNVEDARLLTTALKKSVELSKEEFKNLLKKYESMPDQDLRSLLSKYVKDITIEEDSYEQELTTETEDACKIIINGADVSKGESYTYKFNLIDINPLAIEYITKSDEVFVNLETLGEKDLIEYSEEGVVEGFENELAIRAENVEEARLMALIIKKLAEKCQE